jgi:hypothetical protein
MLGEEMLNTNDLTWIWRRVNRRYTELAKWNLVAEYNSGRWNNRGLRPLQTVDNHLIPNYLNYLLG